MRSPSDTCMNRRRALTAMGTVGLTGLTGLAGCLGEDGEFEYTASPAAIPAAAEEGYRADGPESIEIDEPVEVAGVSRNVHIETWSVVYAKEITQTSVFLFSTPEVSLAGMSVNPLARLSGVDLIVRVLNEGLGQAEGDSAISEIEQEDELTLSVLGEERTAPVFSGVLDIGNGNAPQGGPEGVDTPLPESTEDGKIPVRLYLLSFTHEEDVLLSVGFHPEMADAREDIVSLMESIEHPVEAEATTNESTTL